MIEDLDDEMDDVQPIRIQLPQPHINQQKVLNSKARFRVIQAGRRYGKSLLSHIIVIQRMLAGQEVAYVTPTHELSRRFYKTILRYLPSQLIASDNKTDRTIRLHNDGLITFYSGENLDAFRGTAWDLIILDEAAHIPDLKTQWGESIRPTLTDRQGQAIIISTPKGMGWFHSQYLKGVNKEDGYESFHFTTYDNPTIPVSEIEAMRSELTDMQYQQEVLALDCEDVGNPFGTANIRANTITTLSTEPTVCFSADIARSVDYTVIVGMDINGHMTHFDRFQAPWEVTKERINNLPHDTLCIIDSTGVGSVLNEQLQRERPNIVGYTFTNQSKANLIYTLIRDVEKGNVKFNETTANEMMVFQYKYSSTGLITFQAALGYHDDTIMALSLCNYYRNRAVATKDWKLWLC